MEKIFIKDLAMLKNLDNLVSQMIAMIRKTLYVKQASLYIRRGYSGKFADSLGNFIDTDAETEQILMSGDFFERSLIESEEEINSAAGKLIPVFNISGSEYIVPLVHKRELIAILTLTEKINSVRIKDNEIKFICNLSTYATIALANSVMYQNLSDIKDNLEQIVVERTALIEKQKSDMESDIQLARKIQLALLPINIPDVKNLKVAYKYEPIMGVGGDFIDIHYREGMDEFGIFICDVSGHGSSSAMIASMVKMSLNSWGKFILHPASAFIEIRNLLRGKIGDNFITAFMCCIDLTSGVITSACAGHPPMILIRKTGKIELVKPSGKILFDLIDSEYEEIKKTLNDGDKIVLYTDGVFETRDSSGKIIGEERFIQILSDNFNLPADKLCDKIYNDIFTPMENIIDDDFALLVAEYKS
jgi:serine phosphatase RsbU (regulator of sigma subunit)